MLAKPFRKLQANMAASLPAAPVPVTLSTRGGFTPAGQKNLIVLGGGAAMLVALPEFKEQKGDEAKAKFLYERIYQRPPTAEEMTLCKEFIDESPVRSSSAATASDAGSRPNAAAGRLAENRRPAQQRPGARRPRDAASAPAQLTAWEKYAHALLEANELVYVN